MKTYTEFLKENGATEDEIKVLVTPKAESAYAKMMAEVDASQKSAKEAQDKLTQYDNWYNTEAAPQYQSALNEAASARARAAAFEEQLKTAREYGLAPKDDTQPSAPPPKKDEPPVIDPRYVTADTLKQTAEIVGDNWADMADIMQEHHRLFGTDVPMAELRKDAISQKKHIKQIWADKYQVPANRDELAQKAKTEYENKIRQEERQKVLSEMGNPQTRPLMPSDSPFTKKPSEPTAQPWAKSETQASNDRVARAVKNLPVQ